MFRNSILCGVLMLLSPIFFTSCIVSTHSYNRYDPIDVINSSESCIQYVYIQRHRPPRFYSYNNWWYTEPYSILIFEDSSGYRVRQKVPNSLLRNQLEKKRPFMKRKKDIDSIMKDVNKRKRIRKRIKGRT